MPTTPAATEASLPGGHRKRWLLWAALVVVLCALVGTAMVLANFNKRAGPPNQP